MDTAFFNAVRGSLYAGALNDAQVAGLNAIEQAWEQYGDGDNRKLAYIFATAHHETGAFKYTKEIWGPTAQQKKYEGRADLGNTVAGDGKKFMGRGFVQLTGRRNYADWSKRTGLDLLKEPDLVSTPAVAARILVQGSMLGTFTGKSLAGYIGANKADYVQARRVINGADKAALIAGYADKFLAAINASEG
jgi:predicted chitinase